jgi:NAD(P)-dependent dehydrogenase (short-subunit alcohol dehydrogenase family)
LATKKELANALKKEGIKGELHPVQCDVTKEEDIKNVIQWTKKQLGGVDVLVNNAGVNRYSKLSGKFSFMWLYNITLPPKLKT